MLSRVINASFFFKLFLIVAFVNDTRTRTVEF